MTLSVSDTLRIVTLEGKYCMTSNALCRLEFDNCVTSKPQLSEGSRQSLRSSSMRDARKVMVMNDQD